MCETTKISPNLTEKRKYVILQLMKRSLKLEKYIKRHTGHEIKVFIVKWIKGGFGAYINNKRLKICEDDMDYKPLLWHEMGHLIDGDYNWVKNEYKAQKWALKTLKKLKYNNIYQESIEWIKLWGKRDLTICDRGYRKASRMLLGKI
jgi:ATP:corrinoid adenosyltransferase